MTRNATQPLYTGAEWSFPLLEQLTGEIQRIADEELGLDYYPFQLEIVTSEQMLDAYASAGLPVGYTHWSYGKHYVMHEQNYKRGAGLAYEMVINSNPCIAYCMEENTATMQALVIAHAAIGHNTFFTNNYLFKQWTQPEEIIDYLLFAQRYIARCEERHGVAKVEKVLDSCHSLQMYGVDRYTHPTELSVEEEEKRQGERAEYIQRHLNVLWNSQIYHEDEQRTKKKEVFPREPQENILAFIEKNAPELPLWKREIIRIVRHVGQYLFPQGQLQLMNEGFACFVHYYIMGRLYEKELITDGAYQEFLHAHTNVCYQPESGNGNIITSINPYALGFQMYRDIRRVCEHPTQEDKDWFPDITGSDWLETIKYAVENFKDESFVRQFLSPKIVRDFGLFVVLDDSEDNIMEVTAIQNENGFREVRSALADSYDFGLKLPNIEAVKVATHGDRTLTLRHTVINDTLLDEEATQLTLEHVQSLWGFPVDMEIEHDEARGVLWRVDNEGYIIQDPYKDEDVEEDDFQLILP